MNLVPMSATAALMINLMRRFRKVVYSIKKPELILLDVNSALFDTYENQEGEGFNYHFRQDLYRKCHCIGNPA